jgi:hypothetical protein
MQNQNGPEKARIVDRQGQNDFGSPDVTIHDSTERGSVHAPTLKTWRPL